MIRLSEKHGVNPTIPVCFWCGNEKNEIALLGKLPNDAEAPMHAVLDFEPCEECRKKFNSGVTLFEVTDRPIMEGQPPINRSNLYLSGRYVVVKPEIIRVIIINPELAENIIKAKKGLIDEEVFEQLIKK